VVGLAEKHMAKSGHTCRDLHHEANLPNTKTVHQTLSLGRKSELANREVNSSVQAIRIRSGVAGLSKGNQSLYPASARAAIMASLMAKKDG